MPKLRVISGKKLVRIFENFGFIVKKQNGSHIKMRRVFSGAVQILVIPNHVSMAKGTLKEIYNQACKCIPEKEIKNIFYT